MDKREGAMLETRLEGLTLRVAKSSREKVPSSRFDLSMTGMCGAIFFSLTIQLSVSAEP